MTDATSPLARLAKPRALAVVAAVYTLLIFVAIATFPMFDDVHPLYQHEDGDGDVRQETGDR